MSEEDLGRAVIVAACHDLQSCRADVRSDARRFFDRGDFEGWAMLAGVRPSVVLAAVARIDRDGRTRAKPSEGQ